MNDAGVAPPGVIPIQQPIRQLRSEMSQYAGSFFHVSKTTLGLIFADLPENDRPSSIDSRISPMPKRPITAIRKSKPRIISVDPNVSRRRPVMLSIPTAASAKPSIIAASVFHAEPLPMPMKLQNVSRKTEKILRRAELQREFRDQRREERDHDHGEQRADE